LIGVFFGPKVDDLDAWGGSPVLDIKPYLPQMDSKPSFCAEVGRGEAAGVMGLILL
jgi:tRNA (Thr-GGU) A37 N-methylase